MPLAARMWQAVQCAEVTLDLRMVESVLGSWKDVSDSFLTTRTNGLVHLTNLEASIRAAPERIRWSMVTFLRDTTSDPTRSLMAQARDELLLTQVDNGAGEGRAELEWRAELVSDLELRMGDVCDERHKGALARVNSLEAEAQGWCLEQADKISTVMASFAAAEALRYEAAVSILRDYYTPEVGGAPLADPLMPRALQKLSADHAALTATLAELFSSAQMDSEGNVDAATQRNVMMALEVALQEVEAPELPAAEEVEEPTPAPVVEPAEEAKVAETPVEEGAAAEEGAEEGALPAEDAAAVTAAVPSEEPPAAAEGGEEGVAAAAAPSAAENAAVDGGAAPDEAAEATAAAPVEPETPPLPPQTQEEALAQALVSLRITMARRLAAYARRACSAREVAMGQSASLRAGLEELVAARIRSEHGAVAAFAKVLRKAAAGVDDSFGGPGQAPRDYGPGKLADMLLGSAPLARVSSTNDGLSVADPRSLADAGRAGLNLRQLGLLASALFDTTSADVEACEAAAAAGLAVPVGSVSTATFADVLEMLEKSNGGSSPLPRAWRDPRLPDLLAASFPSGASAGVGGIDWRALVTTLALGLLPTGPTTAELCAWASALSKEALAAGTEASPKRVVVPSSAIAGMSWWMEAEGQDRPTLTAMGEVKAILSMVYGTCDASAVLADDLIMALSVVRGAGVASTGFVEGMFRAASSAAALHGGAGGATPKAPVVAPAVAECMLRASAPTASPEIAEVPWQGEGGGVLSFAGFCEAARPLANAGWYARVDLAGQLGDIGL